MADPALRVQRTYLVLTLFTTLAASFIWGINTLFLLDAGLDNAAGVRGQRLLHRRPGAVRGPDRRGRGHARSPLLVPARDRDPHAGDPPVPRDVAGAGRPRRLGDLRRSSSASGSRSSRARPRRGSWTRSRPPGTAARSRRSSRRPRSSPVSRCSPGPSSVASSPRRRTWASRTCSGPASWASPSRSPSCSCATSGSRRAAVRASAPRSAPSCEARSTAACATRRSAG